jgi:hypothetical protein
MKRVRYGKHPQKTIYIPPNSQDDETWQEVVDYATQAGEGIGALLMKAWRKMKIVRGN